MLTKHVKDPEVVPKIHVHDSLILSGSVHYLDPLKNLQPKMTCLHWQNIKTVANTSPIKWNLHEEPVSTETMFQQKQLMYELSRTHLNFPRTPTYRLKKEKVGDFHWPHQKHQSWKLPPEADNFHHTCSSRALAGTVGRRRRKHPGKTDPKWWALEVKGDSGLQASNMAIFVGIRVQFLGGKGEEKTVDGIHFFLRKLWMV